MQQLIQLRWMAVVGQIVDHRGRAFRLRHPASARSAGAVLACLAAFNIASQLRCRTQREVTNAELFVALLVDVFMLTAQLYLTGGATNPFVFLYLLAGDPGCRAARSPGRPGPSWASPWPASPASRCSRGRCRCRSTTTAAWPAPTSRALLICFALNAALLVIFITRISRNLRARDARLADLRQRAAEEEHIVRMGLLASGAAHELGTPLATLSVILGDWRRMPAFSRRPRTAAGGRRDAGPGAALQDHRERHPAVGRRGARRIVGRGRPSAPSWTTWPKSGARRAPPSRLRLRKPLRPRPADGLGLGPEADDLQRARQCAGGFARLASARGDTRRRRADADRHRRAARASRPRCWRSSASPTSRARDGPAAGSGCSWWSTWRARWAAASSARNRPEGGAEVRLSLPLAAITLQEDEGYGS